MHHHEMATIAGGMQRGRGFGDVLADDGHVADLAIALTEIEMGEADGAGVVRHFRLLECAVVESDGPRLFAARERDPAVQAPQVGMQRLRQIIAIRGAAKGRSGLCKIALQEVRFSKHDANTQLVFARQRGRRSQQRRKQFDRGSGLAAFERRGGSGDDRL